MVGQVLGRGGQATVYKLAFADGRSEALKVIDTSVYRDPARRKDANRRGRSEIRYQKQLSDKTDTVCKLYDSASSCERSQDAPMGFLLRMELLKPLDPKNLAALDPANREKAVLQIMRDVLEGLCQTEDAGIVHRDVKCGNILLRHDPATGQSRFVLSDFGLARPFHTRTDRSFFTVCGSSDHIAPEIIRRGKLIAGRSDIYSAGVMLFHRQPAIPSRCTDRGKPAFDAARCGVFPLHPTAAPFRSCSEPPARSRINGRHAGKRSNTPAPRLFRSAGR